MFSLDEEFLKELAPHLMNRYAVFPWGPCHQVVRVVYMGKSYLAINRTINNKSNVTLDLSVHLLIAFQQLRFSLYFSSYTRRSVLKQIHLSIIQSGKKFGITILALGDTIRH